MTLSCVLGDSGGVVNSLDFCPASLKSLGCFYFRCVLSSHIDTSKNTKAWAVLQHIDTSKNTKAWAVLLLIHTSKNTKAWAVLQHTDTNRNTKARAVTAH